MKTISRIISLLAIVSLISNCIIWPLPDIHKDQINQLQSQITVGVTSKEEVISVMGEPDFSTSRWIIYTRRVYEGGVVIGGIGDGTVGFGSVDREFMDLYFEFDTNGTLTEFRTDKYDMRVRSDKDDWDPSKWHKSTSIKSREGPAEEVCEPGLDFCN